MYPGTYVLSRKDERISELMSRAGGPTAEAYVSGASLKRPGPAAIAKNKGKKEEQTDAISEQEKIKQLSRLQKSIKDTTRSSIEEEVKANLSVGIRLEKILSRPGSNIDLIMEEGDTLTVPRKLQTIKVSGQVLSPISMVYRSGKSLKQYVREAGGINGRGLLKKAYVLYPNGGVKSTHAAFGIRFYPRIKAGSEIFVPQREDKKKLSPQELLGITSGIASLGAIILGIINLTN